MTLALRITWGVKTHRVARRLFLNTRACVFEGTKSTLIRYFLSTRLLFLETKVCPNQLENYPSEYKQGSFLKSWMSLYCVQGHARCFRLRSGWFCNFLTRRRSSKKCGWSNCQSCLGRRRASSPFLLPGRRRGNGTYESTPKNVYTSLLGTSFPFLRLSLLQTPTNKFPRSLTSETWGFPLTRLSPHQYTAEKLRIQQGDCFSLFPGLSRNYQRLSHCTVL